MTWPTHMWEIEKEIIGRFLDAALERGYNLTVNDGEEVTLRHSTDREAIQREVHATELTIFGVFYPVDGVSRFIGSIVFIHGNQEDVIHDYSDNDAMTELVKVADPYSV